jgi:hypothetical protein
MRRALGVNTMKLNSFYVVLLFCMILVGCSEKDLPLSNSPSKLYAGLFLKDSIDQIKTSFHASEKIYMECNIINNSNHPQTAGAPVIYPAARFFIRQRGSIIGDSFSGQYFPAMPIDITLQPGDTMKAIWNASDRVGPFNVGAYVALAQPSYIFPDLQGMSQLRMYFMVTH